MTRATKQPRRRDLVATRAALLDAAAEVFSRRGLDAASLEEIAETAGFTRGAVYHHFVSKEDLFLAVIARRDEELLAGYGSDVFAELPPDAVATGERWRQLHADSTDVALRLELRSHALRSPALREQLLAVDRAAIAATAARLAEVAEQRGGRWRVPVEQVAALCHMVSHEVSEQAVLTGVDTADLMATFVDLVWGGSAIEPEEGKL